MELIIAKSAGFCYGVKRAIDITENTLLQYNKVYIKGNIVNNTIVVKKFEEKGLKKFESITELNKGDNILIRAHGCTPLEVKEYELCGCNIIDATCPNVKNIHNIVQKHANTEYKIIIIGDKNHPEVLGIAGNSGTNFEIINDIDEIKTYDKVCIVEQTTFSKQYAQ